MPGVPGEQQRSQCFWSRVTSEECGEAAVGGSGPIMWRRRLIHFQVHFA